MPLGSVPWDKWDSDGHRGQFWGGQEGAGPTVTLTDLGQPPKKAQEVLAEPVHARPGVSNPPVPEGQIPVTTPRPVWSHLITGASCPHFKPLRPAGGHHSPVRGQRWAQWEPPNPQIPREKAAVAPQSWDRAWEPASPGEPCQAPRRAGGGCGELLLGLGENSPGFHHPSTDGFAAATETPRPRGLSAAPRVGTGEGPGGASRVGMEGWGHEEGQPGMGKGVLNWGWGS